MLLIYHKTNVPDLQSFLRVKFASWAINGSCVEEMWKRFKETVFEIMERFVPHKILRENIADPEYYSKEVKRLKAKLSRVYSKRNLGERYQVELKRIYLKNCRRPKKKNSTGNILTVSTTK